MRDAYAANGFAFPESETIGFFANSQLRERRETLANNVSCVTCACDPDERRPQQS